MSQENNTKTLGLNIDAMKAEALRIQSEQLILDPSGKNYLTKEQLEEALRQALEQNRGSTRELLKTVRKNPSMIPTLSNEELLAFYESNAPDIDDNLRYFIKPDGSHYSIVELLELLKTPKEIQFKNTNSIIKQYFYGMLYKLLNPIVKLIVRIFQKTENK